jgi:hypothetical protein
MVQPVPREDIFGDPDWYTWCGSPTMTADGRCHLFYSRWPRRAGHNAWVVKSEIAHAIADRPEGPYRFADVALPSRGGDWWDGDCTHNPCILQIDGGFVLFYMGNHGDGTYAVHRNNQRIGAAIARHPEGPWQRCAMPIIDIAADADAFDSLCVTNPAAVLRPDGTILMIYKAVARLPGRLMGGAVRYGAATADHPLGPYRKVPGRIFSPPRDDGTTWMVAEDPFVWYSRAFGERYYAIARDVIGAFTGEIGGIAQFQSRDGLEWEPAAHPLVLRAQFTWADGASSGTKLERPSLLFDHEVPIFLFGAIDVNQPSPRCHALNVHIPLVDPR